MAPTPIDYVATGLKAIDLILSSIEAARAANDDAAVAQLETALADSTVGQRLVAKAEAARAAMAAGRAEIGAVREGE